MRDDVRKRGAVIRQHDAARKPLPVPKSERRAIDCVSFRQDRSSVMARDEEVRCAGSSPSDTGEGLQTSSAEPTSDEAQ